MPSPSADQGKAIDRGGRTHAQLAADFAAAVAGLDLPRARALMQSARERGLDAGGVYTELIRPAVQLVATGSAAASRGSAEVGLAVLADALGAETAPPGHGTGRSGLIAHGESTMEQLDGEAISAFSRWAGWRVDRLRVDAEQRELSDLARGEPWSWS